MLRWMTLFLAMLPFIAQADIRIGQTSVDSLTLTYSNPRTGSALDVEQTRMLIERLYRSELLNLDDILAAQQLDASGPQGDGFQVINPYYPRAEGGDFPCRPLARSCKAGCGSRIPSNTRIRPRGMSWKKVVRRTISKKRSAAGSASCVTAAPQRMKSVPWRWRPMAVATV